MITERVSGKALPRFLKETIDEHISITKKATGVDGKIIYARCKSASPMGEMSNVQLFEVFVQAGNCFTLFIYDIVNAPREVIVNSMLLEDMVTFLLKSGLFDEFMPLQQMNSTSHADNLEPLVYSNEPILERTAHLLFLSKLISLDERLSLVEKLKSDPAAGAELSNLLEVKIVASSLSQQ